MNNPPQHSAYQQPKLFIIGLPRTGTTSVSVALLQQGFHVAHQAFTMAAFEKADVVSDAPCFSDYPHLDNLFPQAKFVYLDRPMDKWLPSMQMLLQRMLPHLDKTTGRFHPIMKRSFQHCFDIWQAQDVFDPNHLSQCYIRHQQQVFSYFAERDNFLSLDISQPDSLERLLKFIGITTDEPQQFPLLNVGRNVASWDEYKHPNKVSANLSGEYRRQFFSYTLTP
ncbi:sulfotransferase family protein [Shewanella gaetbuli]|uniref:Sulfotransferase family protein n=1 Tax=Shewanella gaetbuli TaxID=220752 RepID=A0A9X1ZJF7_9GAMM|nr:sulfotransferase family protein [Shewanella gaetbuli]MCL1143444.1 sulfotransferase family protein [Shewanella gaetbuli]